MPTRRNSVFRDDKQKLLRIRSGSRSSFGLPASGCQTQRNHGDQTNRSGSGGYDIEVANARLKYRIS